MGIFPGPQSNGERVIGKVFIERQSGIALHAARQIDGDAGGMAGGKLREQIAVTIAQRPGQARAE